MSERTIESYYPQWMPFEVERPFGVVEDVDEPRYCEECGADVVREHYGGRAYVLELGTEPAETVIEWVDLICREGHKWRAVGREILP